jgi:hypothetical protein
LDFKDSPPAHSPSSGSLPPAGGPDSEWLTVDYSRGRTEQVISKEIMEQLRSDNRKFLLDRQLFNPDYFTFILDFMKIAHYVPIREYSILEVLNPSLSLIQLGTRQVIVI